MFRSVEESQTLLINSQSKELLATGRELIQFGFGQSPFLPPKDVIEALKNSADRKEYTSVAGDMELRRLISKFHQDHNGLSSTADNIILSPGSKILLFTILMAFEKADVLIPSPSWVSYQPQAGLARHNLITIGSSLDKRWRVTPNNLTIALSKKKFEASILILNFPGNPDGLSYNNSELVELADICRKNKILVISDEIYALLDHELNHSSFANYYPERTITTTGLSKWCGAGGWRFGAALLYETIEPEFKKALIGIASETYSCAPTPIQMAARVAYNSYQKREDYLKYQISILQQVGRYCANALREATLDIWDPSGAFYLFPGFSNFSKDLKKRNIETSTQLCRTILQETGVAMLPASAFGFQEKYLASRIAYVDFDEPGQDTKFNLQLHGERIVRGIHLITEWLRAL